MFIDGDNIDHTFWEPIRSLIRRLGEIAVIRVYGLDLRHDWGRLEGLDVIEVPEDVRGPNAADFLLTFDMARMLPNSDYDEFVVVSNDTGLAPAVLAACQRGKRTHVVAPFGHRLARDNPFVGATDSILSLKTGVIDSNGELVPNELLLEVLRKLGGDPDGWVNISAFVNALIAIGIRINGRATTTLEALGAFESKVDGNTRKIRPASGH